MKLVKRKPVAYGTLAVDSDWPKDGKGGCQAVGPLGQKCSVYVKHTGLAHQLCRRYPHDGHCIGGCFEEVVE